MKLYTAHIRNTDRCEQTVAEHCLETAKIAAFYGKMVGLSETAKFLLITEYSLTLRILIHTFTTRKLFGVESWITALQEQNIYNRLHTKLKKKTF